MEELEKYKITNKISKEVVKEILNIKEENGLTAETVVNRAENKNNPLHNLFVWDNTEAARLWRLQQARVLINEIEITIEDKDYYAFENVSVVVSKDTEPVRAYLERREIISNKELRTQVIESAKGQLFYWRDKYTQYNVFLGVVKAINGLEKKEKKVKEKVKRKVKAVA